jgi:hypothetical protein
MRTIGQEACRNLFARIAAPGSQDAIIHEMKLVARESSGPAPAQFVTPARRAARK